MPRISKKDKKAFIAIALMMLIAIISQAFVSAKLFNPDRVVVWIFDVGQGDAIFIDAPDKQILIDGGPNSVILEKLSSVMPFWDRSIDIVVNTHPHADHLVGINYVLDRYFVGEVFESGQDYNTDIVNRFDELTDNEQSVKTGDIIELGGGAKLEILWPEADLSNIRTDDPNSGSVVALLTYGETTILLTGDIGADEELEIMNDLPLIDILKVAHHGSLYSSSPRFLREIKPRYAIFPVGKNSYGHPSPIVIDRLLRIGAEILRTDLDGDIRIISDGGEPEIKIFDL